MQSVRPGRVRAKAEEDHVVAAVGLPGEQVGLNEAHPLVADAGCRDGEHLRGRVDSGDLARVAEQVAGPHAGTAGKLKHAAVWPKCIKRLGHFVAAGKVQALVQIVCGQGPVVGALLIEERAEFFTVARG